MTGTQRLWVFYRAIGLAVILTFAAAFGLYFVAIFHDPSTALRLSLLQTTLEVGLIIIAFYAPKIALVAICAAAVIAFVPQLAGVGRAFVAVRYRWPCAVAAALGIVVGTIIVTHLNTTNCC